MSSLSFCVFVAYIIAQLLCGFHRSAAQNTGRSLCCQHSSFLTTAIFSFILMLCAGTSTGCVRHGRGDPMVFYFTVLDRITEVFSGLLLPQFLCPSNTSTVSVACRSAGNTLTISRLPKWVSSGSRYEPPRSKLASGITKLCYAVLLRHLPQWRHVFFEYPLRQPRNRSDVSPADRHATETVEL